MPANLLPDAVAVQQFIEFVGALDNGDAVVLCAEVEVDVFLHRADGLFSGIDMTPVDGAGIVLPDHDIVGLRSGENRNDFLRGRQLRFIRPILFQLPHSIVNVLLRQLVLRLNENYEFIALELDVGELVFLVGMTDKELFVVLPDSS